MTYAFHILWTAPHLCLGVSILILIQAGRFRTATGLCADCSSLSLAGVLFRGLVMLKAPTIA